MCQWPYCLTCSGHIPWHHYISKMLLESYYLMIIHRVSIIGEMQRGCMETAALVLDQKTFSFHRKLNLNFMQKNFFYQSCVCKVVEPMFETGFWPFYWVSSGGWWLYRLMYPHRFSGSKRKYLNWLLVLNMLGFVKFWHFFLWWLRPQLHSSYSVQNILLILSFSHIWQLNAPTSSK